MSQIVILGHFEIHPEDAAAAAELMAAMTEATVKEKGCLHYAYARHVSQSNRFELSELWESADALEAHFGTQHMADYRAGMKNLRVEKRAVTRYQVTNPSDL